MEVELRDLHMLGKLSAAVTELQAQSMCVYTKIPFLNC